MLQLPRYRLLHRLLPGLLSLFCVLIFAACSDKNPSEESTRLANNSVNAAAATLKVATSANFPPFVSKRADGALEGFDIDVMNAVSQAAGFSMQYQDQPLIGDVVRSLYAKTVDAAIYAVSITPARAQVVAFSRPYFKSGLVIATRTANNSITSIDSLQGKRIGVEAGTTGDETAKKIQGVNVQLFETAPIALQSLAKGELDAVINDAPVTDYLINSGKVRGLKIVGKPLTEEFYGIATPKNSPRLKAINAGLTTILQNGEYAKIYKKWFATEPPQLPVNPSETSSTG